MRGEHARDSLWMVGQDCNITLIVVHSDEMGEDADKLYQLQSKPFLDGDETATKDGDGGGAQEEDDIEVVVGDPAAAAGSKKRAREEGDEGEGPAVSKAKGTA